MAHPFDYHKDFFNFLEGSFIAINQMDATSAKDLYHACKELEPNHVLTRVLSGYLHFMNMQLQQAHDVFEKILHEDPHNEMAKAFMGITLSFSAKTVDKGEKILHELEAHAHDPAIRKLSHDGIGFADQFIKKQAPKKK